MHKIISNIKDNHKNTHRVDIFISIHLFENDFVYVFHLLNILMMMDQMTFNNIIIIYHESEISFTTFDNSVNCCRITVFLVFISTKVKTPNIKIFNSLLFVIIQ